MATVGVKGLIYSVTEVRNCGGGL